MSNSHAFAAKLKHTPGGEAQPFVAGTGGMALTNMDITRMMLELMEAQREHKAQEMNRRVLSAVQEMNQTLLGLVR